MGDGEFMGLIGNGRLYMYRLYNEVEVSTGYTRPSAAGTRLCIL